MPEKRNLLKNPWFWVSGCLILFVVIGLIAVSVFFIIRSNIAGNETDTYKSAITEIWSDIETASSDLIDESEKAKDASTLASFMVEASDYEESIEDAQEEIKIIDAPEEYSKAHNDLVDAVEDILEYAKELNSTVKKDTSAVSNESLIKVGNTGVKARKSEQDALEQIDFLQGLPEKVYEVRLDLQTAYESVWKKEAQDQKKAKEAEANKVQEQNLSAAKSTVDNFMAAYLKSDVASLKKYLSGEALNEFDADLEFSGDSEPVSYVIASSDINPLKNYRYYVNITYQDIYGAKSNDQFKFVVGKVGNDLLIIRRKYEKKL